MNYADLVQETTAATSAATVSLLGASAGLRTFAAAFTNGATDIPVCIKDASGNFEVSLFTLTSAALLTRTAVLASSNSGAAVTFPAGTKTVGCVLPAKAMAAGLGDPDDVGFDIILCAGQSNMEGNPTSDPLIDVGDPGQVFQWANSSADTASYRQIISGVDPLYMPSGIRTGKTGLATWAAKAYLGTVPRNRKVLIVPVAVGSTALVGSLWAVGGTYYNRAITDSNLAISAALLMYPNSRFVGVLWAQGEADGLTGTTQAQYAAGLKAAIAGFRANITGAASSWVVISPMTPEGITAHTGEVAINAAHAQVAVEIDKCVKVAPISGYAADVHWTAPGARIMGTRLGLATVAAKTAVGSDATAPAASSAVVQDASPSTVTLTFSEALDAGYVPASSDFAISGHATTGTPVISGSTIAISVTTAFINAEAASTASYVQPASNGLRDATGNLVASFSGLTITNNVAAVDATAPTLTSPTGTQTGTTTATIGATTNEATGTLYALVSVNATETAATVKASGATQAITTSGAKTYNATGLTAATLYYGHLLHRDAAGNDSTVATSASFTTAASATAPATMAAPTATAGDTTASVVLVAPADGGSAITGYTVTSSPAGGVDTNAGGTGLTHAITGLANGTAYTFTATATNAIGTSAASPASNSVTPAVVVAYTTFNPADKATGITLSNGDLTAAGTAGFKSVRGIAGKSTGKWYVEYKMTAGTAALVGMGKSSALLTNFPGSNQNSYGYYTTGALYYSNAAVQTNSTWTTNDIIGMALDLDGKTIQFYKNNVAQGTPRALEDGAGTPWVSGGVAYPMAGPNGATILANFGATAFTYTPPTGYSGWLA